MVQSMDEAQWPTLTKKVVLLGATAVGKTSIFNRIQQDIYIEDNVTTMAAYFRPKVVEFPEYQCKVKINLWDTAGQERFQALTRQYISSAEAVILVYDLTDPQSLQEAKDWYQRMSEQVDPQQLVLALVGNKADDVDMIQVSRKDAQAVGTEMKAQIQMELSAKTGLNVEKMFQTIGKELAKRDGSISKRSSSVMLKPTGEKPKKGGCCGGKKDKK